MNATAAEMATVIALPERTSLTDVPDFDGPLGELIAFPSTYRGNDDLNDNDVPDTIPASVWDEVDASFERALELELTGRHVRFTRGAGRVRVEVLDDEGRVLRPVSLGEAVGFSGLTDDPPYAA